MRDRLRAGAAVFNDGYYHAAHDAWEDRWLELESGGDDERLLHGLIQYSAAVFHARERNWEGAVGLAESAGEYLAGLPADYRDLRLDPVRSFLSRLAADPELLERRPPVRIEHEGSVPTLPSLDFEATSIAAVVLAEEFGYDDEPVARARRYARQDLEDGEDDSVFITLLFDFVREDENRGIIAQRLMDHVGRRRAREEDVEGLF
ncbi:DUF309 domain-containing protein [Natrinema salsiterrestre]|uniref:DUF309 domain-containing protein n=1 Tax=Natrinema salsiterrestre TaxID=2950540 RepID=A0A9Q4L3G1_9EURY|nr:DUF309 domain-containing protein [Natrinema salsiterrestre]MDF9745812.1 DUF309 domain-containing protein [Natrinema salsiterrestre]